MYPVNRFLFVFRVLLLSFGATAGLLLFGSGDAQLRLQAELQAMEEKGANLERLRSVAGLYERLGDFEAAAQYFRLASEAPGNGAEDVVALARVYVKSGKAEEALAMLKDGVIRFPDSAELLYAQGMVYLAMDKVPAATYALQRAAKLAPDDPKINYKLAEVYFRRGNLERAETLLEPLVDAEVAFEDAVLLYGQVLFADERERQGLRVIERYFKSNEDNAKVRGALVALLLKNAMNEAEAGRISRAVKMLQEANEIVPSESQILMGLSLLENEQGNAGKSIEYCKEIIDTDPGDLEAYSFLGRMQRVEGLADESEQTFKQGLALAKERGERKYIEEFSRLLNPFE